MNATAVSALLDTGLEMDEATTAGAMRRVPPLADTLALRVVASAVSAFLNAGLEMDEATTAAVFRATADVVDRTEADRWTRRPCPLSSTRASRWTRCRQPRPSWP